MTRGIAVVVVAFATGCTFASPAGNGGGGELELGEPDLDPDGEDSSADPSDDGAAPEPEPEPEPEPGQDDGGYEGDGGDAGDDDGSGEDDGTEPLPPSDPPGADDGGAGEDDGGADDGSGPSDAEACEGFVDLIWAEDAAVEAPMELGVATQASGEPMVALSETADAGTVAFALELPCAGDFYVHGLVWDYAPGAWGDPDADSYHVGVGGPDEFVWRYGCQTLGQLGALSWQSLERLDDQPCTTTPIVLQASAAGSYVLTLRNREAGEGSAVAGIAAILVTTDPALDPYAEYAPY